MNRQNILNALTRIYDSHESQAIFRLLEEAWAEGVLDEDTESIQSLIHRIENHTPIQYILERTYFYDDFIFLKHPVLIPRPETEELVHWMIHENNHHKSIWDIGTGSGCIAVTLAKKLQNPTLFATDIDPNALKNIHYNAQFYDTQVQAIEHNILVDEIPEFLTQVEIIVSNPPYIASHEKDFMEKNVLDHEPHHALFTDDYNPLTFYKKIAEISENVCVHTEKVYLELNPIYHEEIKNFFNPNIWNFEIKKDMQGKNRMLKCERKSSNL